MTKKHAEKQKESFGFWLILFIIFLIIRLIMIVIDYVYFVLVSYDSRFGLFCIFSLLTFILNMCLVKHYFLLLGVYLLFYEPGSGQLAIDCIGLGCLYFIGFKTICPEIKFCIDQRTSHIANMAIG